MEKKKEKNKTLRSECKGIARAFYFASKDAIEYMIEIYDRYPYC